MLVGLPLMLSRFGCDLSGTLRRSAEMEVRVKKKPFTEEQIAIALAQ
jgi:hypothetical protein